MFVAHNLLAMNANRMLGINSRFTAKSAEKLSSGYKINRAADDAAGLAISEKMRRQIRGLRQGANNTTDGISWVKIGDGAMNEVNDMLNRMVELSVKAANGTVSDKDRQAVDLEMRQLKREIDRISTTTVFNEIPIFDNTNYQPTMTFDGVPGKLELFDASYNSTTKEFSFGGVIFDGTRISWNEIHPNMVTIDGNNKQIFNPGEYTYAKNGMEFSVIWKDGSDGPILTRTFAVKADSNGITFAGKPFHWEDLVDEDGNPAGEDNVHSGIWTLNYGDSVISFNISKEVDTLDELADAMNTCASESITQNMQRDYIGNTPETAVTASFMQSIKISQELVNAFTNTQSFSIFVGADKDGIYLKDTNGTKITGSEMTWAQMGISSWDNGSDISTEKTYSYEYYTAANPTTPYLAFDFSLSDVTSVDSVIDGLNGMELKNGNITTSYGTTIQVDTTNASIIQFSSAANNISVSFEQEIDLGRDFGNQTDVVGSETVDLQNNGSIDEAVLKFDGANGSVTYTGDVSPAEKVIAADVESYLDYITIWARAAALAGKPFDINTIPTLTDLVGPGNITTSGHLDDKLTIDDMKNWTQGHPPKQGETYPTAFIDFSNVTDLDDLLLKGFNSTCMTCSNHYSVVFKNGLSSPHNYRKDGNNHTLEVDLDYLKKEVAGGKTIAEALVDVLSGVFDFHYTQYAAGPPNGTPRDDNTLYIFDHRPEHVGDSSATFDTKPFNPNDQGTYSVDLDSTGNGTIQLNYTYSFKEAASYVNVEMRPDPTGDYVKNPNGIGYSKYDSTNPDHNKPGTIRYSAVTVYTDPNSPAGSPIVFTNKKAAAASYAQAAVKDMLSSTTVSLASKDYTYMQLSGNANTNVAIRGEFQTTTLTGAYAETGIRIQHSAESNDFTEIPRFALNTMALGLSGASVKTVEQALETLDSLSSACNYVSSKRALYGALQNRLEHTYDNLLNITENTTAAESRIRDTDMAKEMILYSNYNNILQQTGQAMLAQANQSTRGVMSLLS